jgi:GDSL-like Lipase/Acylhydrolase family
MPRLLARCLSYAAITAAVVTGLLILTELTLRALDFPSLRLDAMETRADFAYDPQLGWLPRPNSVKQQTASRTVTLRHNSLGLRDIEVASGNAPTILFLGNSFVWGVEVEARERFTERLRADLPGFRIVNAGIPGYGTVQEYALLQRLWPMLRPDIVVLIFGGGDRRNNTTNYSFHTYKPFFVEAGGRGQIRGQPVPKSAAYYFYNDWLANHSALVRLVILAYETADRRRIVVPDRSEDIVAMMRDFVLTRQAKFLVGVQNHDARMEAFLKSQKIPYTDFDGAEVYPAWGHHWTPAGHTLVAKRLEALLAQQGLIPKDASSP